MPKFLHCRHVVCWPRRFFRHKIKMPLVQALHDTVELYQTRTQNGISNAKSILYKGTIVASVTSLLVWLSVFMYLAFYYAYVPIVSHERPVHLQFKSCQDEKGICSFPSAHVQLTKRQQLLIQGQAYRVLLELEMPESPTNKELGMFMVCADFRGKDGMLITSACRSTMLHYKSWLVNLMHTIAYSPFYIFGGAEEKQNLQVELFADYEDYESRAVTDVYIEVQTQHIQLYSSTFIINAHFSGLRYVMFHWPVLSSIIGITSNLFFIAFICVVTWYQLINSDEYKNLSDANEHKPDMFIGEPDDFNSSFDDDASLLHESEDRKYEDDHTLAEAVLSL